MISIRTHLLCCLLPGFAAICLVAGMGIYFSIKYDQEAKLDTQLTELVGDIRLRPQSRDSSRRLRDRNAMIAEFQEALKRKQFDWTQLLQHLPAETYCQLQLGSPETLIKTANLENQHLPRPLWLTEKATFYNAKLENGDVVRVRAEKMSLQKGARGPKILIALSRKDLDTTLARLSKKLIAGGVGCCIIFVSILTFALNISLRPLRQLGEQAADMDAESLHKRFSEQSIPADIRPIVERLNGLIAKLEESFARERRFSGDIAHELRTPLAAIRSTSEVAIKWPDQASPEDFSEIAELSTQLQQTLDSLLLLARMESSAAEAIREPVKMAPLIHECAALHATTAEKRGLTLTLQLKAAPEINSDPRLLRIMISNLINNAVEYAPEKSEVILSSNASTLFECTNNAPGLAPQDIPHLFERLWRKDKARTESGHTGLGLSITQSCANVLGYALKAELNDHTLHIRLRPS